MKLARRRRSSNASRRRVARRKNRAFSAAIAQFFRQKMRKFVLNFSACRRAMLHNFSRHRCEDFLTSQICCIESVASALPKTRASGVELAQKIASTTPEFVAKFPRMDHAFGARRANLAYSLLKIPFCKSQAVGVALTRVGTLLSAAKARVRRGDRAIFPPENAQIRFRVEIFLATHLPAEVPALAF